MMTTTQRYNDLDGKIVSRIEIFKLIVDAWFEDNEAVFENLANLLEKHQDKCFEISIVNKLPEMESLNAPHHTGDAIDALDDCGRLKKGNKFLKGGKIVKVKKSKASEVKKEVTVIDQESDKYDFIFEVGHKGYSVQSFLELPTSRSVKFYEKKENGVNKYFVSELGLKTLKKAFPKNAYGDKYRLTTKDLKNPLTFQTKSETKKLSKEELETINPKGFDKKPKSVAVSTAIENVLSLKKYTGLTPLQASVLYKIFKDSTSDQYEGDSTYQNSILSKIDDNFAYVITFGNSGFDIELTALGRDFINAVNGRLESLRNQKHNYSMFESLNGNIEKDIPSKKGLGISIEPIHNPIAVTQTTTEIKEPTPGFVVDKGLQKSPDKVLKNLPKGFTAANEKPAELEGIFYLPGEIGEWLGKLQRYRLLILAHGESGGGKSELVKQLANAFLEIGLTGGFFDLEQGGLTSKDTQDSIARNIPAKNLSKIAFTDEAEKGLESIKEVANQFDFIVIDSWQKLNTPATRLDELRIEYPDTIWIVITQETTTGLSKGGSATVFDPPVRIKVFKEDNTFVNNYAEIMKNRGNQNTVGTRYNMSRKQTVKQQLQEAFTKLKFESI